MSENNSNNENKQPRKGFIDYFDDEQYDESDAPIEQAQTPEPEAPVQKPQKKQVNTPEQKEKPQPQAEETLQKTDAEKLQTTEHVEKKKEKSTPKITVVSDHSAEPDNDDYYYEDDDEEETSESGDILLRLIIILSSIALCAVVIYFINVQSGPVAEFKSYVMDLFKDENAEVQHERPQFDSVTSNSMIMPFENASSAEYSRYRSGVLAAKQNYLCYLTPTDGIVWEKNTVIVNPILKSEGNYIMIADKGSRKICLYNREKQIYSIETPNNIKAANVSANGDVVTIQEKDYYKGAVIVYNQNGEEIFSRSYGTDTVIAADISASSRRVAVSLLSTDSKITSTVSLYNIKEEESYSDTILEDSIVFDLDFTDETLNITADNRLVTLSTRGKVLWDSSYDTQTLVHTALDSDGNRLVIVEDNNSALIDYYSSSGKRRFTQKAADIPDYVDVDGTNIVYNSDRAVICGKINSSEMRQFNASMDIQNLVAVNGNVLVVYGNSLAFITV